MYLWAVIYIFCFKDVQNKALTRTMHNAAIFHHFTIFALHLFSLLHIFFNWKCFCNCDYLICVNYYHIVCVMVMEKNLYLRRLHINLTLILLVLWLLQYFWYIYIIYYVDLNQYLIIIVGKTIIKIQIFQNISVK